MIKVKKEKALSLSTVVIFQDRKVVAMTLQEYRAEYERLFRWRALWVQLSSKPEPHRLQSRQDAIERRASIANNRIGVLMQAFDAAASQSD